MADDKPTLFRQGDVLIGVIAPPDEATRAALVRLPRLVLAEGERSGHRHEVRRGRGARLYQDSRLRLLLEVTAERVEVVHPEHGTVPLSRGWYFVWQQQEWTISGPRTVAD